MKTKFGTEYWSLIGYNQSIVAGAVALLFLLPLAAWGDGVVTNCTEANLRDAMTSGGVVTFACDGNITLATTITIDGNTTLDGTGHQVTISGGGAVRVFYLSTNTEFTLRQLTITNGLGTNGGGGIYNAGGILNVTDCTFSGNGALASAGPFAGEPGGGGAVYNAGTFTASDCTFSRNWTAGGPGAVGIGGSGNFAPTSGSPGAPGAGGALCNVGGAGINRCAFVDNSATGGNGGAGGNGAWVYVTWAPHQVGGKGGKGGDGIGGAIFNAGTASIVNSTFAGNVGNGGSGGVGGDGGMIFLSGHADWFPSGNGGDGGLGFGVIGDVSGSLRMTNCTIAANQATAGSGNHGGSGGYPGMSGTNGMAAGGIKSSGSLLMNTCLASNLPGGNCVGALTDAGHNLSSDATCNFTNTGSLNNTDPELGPLADNGGPTLTMALLPGSPAIDAGDTAAAPTTDQRGHRRPVGLAADIGAYEYGTTPRLRIGLPLAGTVEVRLYDASGPSCRWFKSTTLTDWQCVATNQISANGTALFQENGNTGETQRFYKAAVP